MRVISPQDAPQGSPRWLTARAGVITASRFRECRAKGRDGKMSDTARHYAFQLAIERISGVPLDEGYSTWQMKRGQEMEFDARICHMAEIGVDVKEVGIVLSDDGKFGASADGWIGRDGGAEYKCLVGPAELEAIYIDLDSTKYEEQVQGNLWLSEREWWDFCVYCPALESIGLHFWRQRVYRDEKYIAQLATDLLNFDNVVEDFVERLLAQQARRLGIAA